MNIQDRLNKLFEEIQKEDFLQMRGLGNEVPYFIFDYNPKDELVVRQSVRYFMKRATISIKEVNLFNLMIDLFEDITLDGLKQFEEENGTEELFDAMRPTIEEGMLVEKIAEEANEAQVLLISGVGSVFQLIRTHELLNQLHPKITNTPIIVFYPGEYTGQGLKLFNKFETNGYYRAFSI